MRKERLSIIGLTGLTVGLLAVLVWLNVAQVADGDSDANTRLDPEPFIPSETILPDQPVAFPTDI